MHLPNADWAVVELAKLRDYCLNTEHLRGRHKAKVFAAALGLTAAEAPLLQAALLQAAKTNGNRSAISSQPENDDLDTDQSGDTDRSRCSG